MKKLYRTTTTTTWTTKNC